MRLCAGLLSVGASMHYWLMRLEPHGYLDALWLCNVLLWVAPLNLVWRYWRDLGAAVFFWSLLGAISWAVAVWLSPELFRYSSLTSHLILPLVSSFFLQKYGCGRRWWTVAITLGALAFWPFVFLHPDRDMLFLFGFTQAPFWQKGVAVVLLHVYYGLLLLLATSLQRRWLNAQRNSIEKDA